MGSVLHLESFDADAVAEGPSQMPVQNYADGYAAGMQKAQADNAAMQHNLRQELVQSINDAAFGYHEAQAHLIESVTPLLNAMISVVLPELLAPALHAHIRDIVGRALRAELDAPVLLKVHPEQVEAVNISLAGIATPHLTVVGDPDMATFSAWVTGTERETALDLEATLAATKDHLAILLTPPAEHHLTEVS